MARRKNDSLKRKSDTRQYRNICWISTEGQTEKDYLKMNAFKGSNLVPKFPRDIHPGRRNPAQVLKRFIKTMRTEDFKKNDEAWLVVDVDEWSDSEFQQLIEWVEADPRHHLAISNPKFELFLIMHFEKGNGCTTPAKVDATLKRYMPKYEKRISATRFSQKDVRIAIEHARDKRGASAGVIPPAGSTDFHLLAEKLLSDEG